MQVLFSARGSKEHQHAIYYQFGGRDICNNYSQITKFIPCELSSVEELL